MTIIETEQSREIALTEIARGPFVFRFLSYRKSEDAKLNLRSEDYIVSDLNPGKAIFALCDGVGSSFYGDLGSQILGETLLNWLGKISLPNSSMLGKSENANQWLATLSKDLKAELNLKTILATDIIQRKDLSGKDELTSLAEQTQRDDFGTQSNFTCGVMWPKSASMPNGLIVLFWLGNARVRIFNQDTDLTPLLGWGKNPDQLREVWSSKEGVLGTIYTYITDLSKVSTVIAYSDGLENVDGKIHPNLNGAQLEGLVNESQAVKDDDVTFLELALREGEVPGISDDIVSVLRRPVQSVSAQPESDANQFKQKFESLQKRYEEQSSRSRRSQSIFIAFAVILSVLCFSSGLLMGPTVYAVLNPSPTPTITPNPTQTPSMTPSSTETPTSTPTLTETPTATATDTLTLTSTPSQSSTPNLTVIVNQTGTITITLSVTAKP